MNQREMSRMGGNLRSRASLNIWGKTNNDRGCDLSYTFPFDRGTWARRFTTPRAVEVFEESERYKHVLTEHFDETLVFAERTYTVNFGFLFLFRRIISMNHFKFKIILNTSFQCFWHTSTKPFGKCWLICHSKNTIHAKLPHPFFSQKLLSRWTDQSLSISDKLNMLCPKR